jgi:pimeloyl-ACP methyl ester carboxylesterase
MTGKRWILPIMGFRESSRSVTGIEKAWRKIRLLASRDLTVITPYEWDENLSGLANFIFRNSDRPQLTEVMVIAYSWGCGVGFLRFANEAREIGLEIREAVLCDPVYRSRWLPTWLPVNPLSVTPIFRPKIVVPASVRRVEWVRQRMNIPQGHDLVAENPALTFIAAGRYVQHTHTAIDDSVEFQALAEQRATLFAHNL